jgi:two-component system sensor histidine kinase KdpD
MMPRMVGSRLATRVWQALSTLPERGAGAAIGASVVLVAVVTAWIAVLDAFVPVLALGVLYIFAVLPIAIGWGLPFGLAISVSSVLVFNFLFLPPRYTLELADSRNWFALAAFAVTAVVVSELAARLRRQATESALLAGIASSLLEQGSVQRELERIAAETARAVGAGSAQIVLGDRPRLPDETEEGAVEQHELVVGARRVGVLLLPKAEPLRPRRAALRRLLPTLASLLGVALDRERLEREALEAEALRRSDAMKTALLRSVSHDLRTPLMAILTAASTLARSDLSLERDDRRELLATISSEAGRLDRLVANLLDLSRLEAGAAHPQRALWVVDDLVVQALDDLGSERERVDVQLADDAATVSVDPGQIERALANLVENALKYSPRGERVRVEVGRNRDVATVRIVDRGPGIPSRDLERIFLPFHRGAGADARGGAGLGLAIARGFAETNGGRVWAESRRGQGATFVLSLPVVVGVEAIA